MMYLFIGVCWLIIWLLISVYLIIERTFKILYLFLCIIWDFKIKNLPYDILKHYTVVVYIFIIPYIWSFRVNTLKDLYMLKNYKKEEI